MAQWKHAGPITQRSVDRNYALLDSIFLHLGPISVCLYFLTSYYVYFPRNLIPRYHQRECTHDRNADGQFRHICWMSQHQTIRVTDEFSDIYDGYIHHKYRSFPTISEFSDKISELVPEFSDNVGVLRQIYIPSIGVFL